MTKTRPVNALLTLSFIFIWLAPPAVADYRVAVAPGTYFFDYSEYSQNNIELNNEQGLLPGITLKLEYSNNNSLLRLHTSFFDGKVDYTGRTQGGSAHSTDTETKLFTLGIRLMPTQPQLNLHEIFKNNATSSLLDPHFFIDLQYWRWDRDILSRDNVQGLHEIYHWYELEFGLQLKTNHTDHDWYWAELSVLYNINPQMKILLPNSEANLKLGSQPGARLRLGKSWKISSTLALSLSAFAEYWEFGRSNTVFSDDFFGRGAYLTEPRSETVHSGLSLDFSWNL